MFQLEPIRYILEGYVTRRTGYVFNWRLCVQTTQVVRKCVPTGADALYFGGICYKTYWLCFQLETVCTNNTSGKEMYLYWRSSSCFSRKFQRVVIVYKNAHTLCRCGTLIVQFRDAQAEGDGERAK